MRLTQTIEATAEALTQLTPFLENIASDVRDDVRSEMLLAIHELCLNIVRHAYKGIPGQIYLEATHDGDWFEFNITDHAPNSYTEKSITIPDPLSLPEGGWGMMILHRVMDEVNYQRIDGKNIWRLVKRYKQ